MKKSDYQDLTETIEKRDALSAEREQRHQEIQTISETRSRYGIQAQDLRAARRDKRDALERMGVEDPDSNPLILDFDEMIAKVEREGAEAEEETERLQQRIRDIDADMGALRAGSLQTVFHHQGVLDAAEQEVTKLETLLSEHQARVAAASDYEDTLPELEQRREDLLAGIAAGEAKEADLKRLDAKIEEASTKTAEKVANAEAIMDRSGPTLRGLEKRLAAAVAERDRIAALTPSVLIFALRAEAEAAGKEYKRHADNLVEAFEKFQGIAQIMAGIDRKTSGWLGYTAGANLRLPLFFLDCFCDAGKQNRTRYLYDAKQNAHLKPSREREEKRLREQGVRLP